MDILHKSEEDIRNMDLIEYPAAFQYSWITYINRDVRYNMNKIMEEQKGGSQSGSTFDMNWSNLNPIVQASREREIPQRFLDSINKEDNEE